MEQAVGPLLLIEDDDDIRDIVTEALRSAGHDVRVAASGEQGLDRTRELPRPRTIFLDMTLPDMNGWQFLDEKRLDPNIAEIPVVVVTALGRTDRSRARNDVVAWLSKPVDLDDLLAAAAVSAPGTRAPAANRATDAELARQYLERRRADLAAVETAFADSAHAELRLRGHNMRGTAASYGHAELGAIGYRLEQAALAQDAAAEQLAVADLVGYLRRHPA